jgi:hypothetical protein
MAGGRRAGGYRQGRRGDKGGSGRGREGDHDKGGGELLADGTSPACPLATLEERAGESATKVEVTARWLEGTCSRSSRELRLSATCPRQHAWHQPGTRKALSTVHPCALRHSQHVYVYAGVRTRGTPPLHDAPGVHPPKHV